MGWVGRGEGRRATGSGLPGPSPLFQSPCSGVMGRPTPQAHGGPGARRSVQGGPPAWQDYPGRWCLRHGPWLRASSRLTQPGTPGPAPRGCRLLPHSRRTGDQASGPGRPALCTSRGGWERWGGGCPWRPRTLPPAWSPPPEVSWAVHFSRRTVSVSPPHNHSALHTLPATRFWTFVLVSTMLYCR